MKYKIYGNGVQDTEIGSIIPNDERNMDWQDYLAWVDAGNTADPEFTAEEIEATRIAEIKAIAGAKIVERMPEWKQRNNLARMVELMDKASLTAEEEAEKVAAKAEWATIQAIRTTSDTAETNGTAPGDIVWPV